MRHMSDTFSRFTREGPNLTTQILQDLGRAIVTGRFSHGNTFPFESELCQQYSASRPVVREAVKMLTTKGLLVARPRSGTTGQPEDRWIFLDPDVLRWMLQRNLSIELLVDFTEVRLAIEPRAAGMAARGATEAQRDHIMEPIGRSIAADPGEDAALKADNAFPVSGHQTGNKRA